MTDAADETSREARVGEAEIAAASRSNWRNMLWEYTQAALAVSLVWTCIYLSIAEGAVPETIRNATFVVLGFYFGRTNHARFVPRPDGPAEVQEG
jgi:hypothetical protein